MPKKKKRYRMFFVLTLLSFAMAAIALLLIPWLSVQDEANGKTALYLTALMFWLGMIVGIAGTWITNSGLRKIRVRAYSSGKMTPPNLPGMLMFFARPISLVLYLIVLVGVGLIVSDMIRSWVPEKIMFPVLSVTLYAFVVHSVIDGKNYRAYRIMKEGMYNDNIK